MYLALKPTRRFTPSQWLLWNATTQEAIPKVMITIQVDCLEAHITICTQSCIREEIAKEVHWLLDKRYQAEIPEDVWTVGVLSVMKKGLLILKVCVSNLVEYLDHLQVTHNCAYTTLMYAWQCHPVAHSSLQNKTRASTAPLVKQLLKGVFRKKLIRKSLGWHPWNVKKVLDPLHAWGKPSVLNFTHLNTEDSHDLGH